METEPQIVFEHMAPSDALRARAREELAKLEQFFGRITAARIALRAPPYEHRAPARYETTIFLSLPQGREVSVTHSPSTDRHTEDMYASLMDAFAAARRRLQDEVRVMEGSVKAHSAPAAEQMGRIARLMREEGYGFIETDNAHEVFFTRAKVKHKAFDQLKLDMPVYFTEEMGDQGPVATSVRIAPAERPESETVTAMRRPEPG